MKALFLLIFFATLLIAGCDDMSSPFPAGKVSDAFLIDSISGYWQLVEVKDTQNSKIEIDSNLLVIVPFNKKEYLLQTLNFDDSGKVLFKDLGVFRAFITKIGDYKIANVQMLVPGENDKEDYLIYPFYFNSDTLIFHGFSAKKISKEFKSTKELRKFLKTNLGNNNLFSSTRKYIKKYSKLLNIK